MVNIVHQVYTWVWFVYTGDLICDRRKSVYIRDRDRLRQIRDYYNKIKEKSLFCCAKCKKKILLGLLELNSLRLAVSQYIISSPNSYHQSTATTILVPYSIFRYHKDAF